MSKYALHDCRAAADQQECSCTNIVEAHCVDCGAEASAQQEYTVLADLLRVDSSGDELGSDVCTNSYRNPDGPAAVAKIMPVVEALKDLSEAARNACDARQHPPLIEALDDADRALADLGRRA